MKIVNTVFFIAVAVAVGTVIMMMGNEALKKTERSECYQWQQEALDIKEFYLTPDQKAQCDYLNITVKAPVTY